MNNNTAIDEQINKLAKSVKLVAVLSLVINVYEMFQSLKGPTDVQNMISIVVGIVGTPLIWLFGSKLQSRRKLALLIWVVITVVGVTRFMISGDPFTMNISLIMVAVLWAVLTTRLVVWTRTKALT